MNAQEKSLGEPSHLKINNMFDKLARIADNLTKIGKEYDVIKEAKEIMHSKRIIESSIFTFS